MPIFGISMEYEYKQAYGRIKMSTNKPMFGPVVLEITCAVKFHKQGITFDYTHKVKHEEL